MLIDFNLKDGNIVSLSVIKKADSDTHYELIDTDNTVWLELELNDQNLVVISKSEDIIDDEETIGIKLDYLVLEIIEVEKSGADSFNENDNVELNPYDPNEIKVRSDKIALAILSKMIDDKSIDLNPTFQRNLVWSNFQKSRLIESILLRIPLPMFYFSEDEEGCLSVIDGLQRISTIKEFMDNGFPLKGLQYLEKTCGGRYYTSKGTQKGLDIKYTRWFDLTSISANIIDPASPYKVKYDIFRRINTGGKPLNNQEIRNCLTGKSLREALRKMRDLDPFKKATDGSIKALRMDDQEIVLRFLVFYKMYETSNSIEGYNGYMEATLDEFTENHMQTKMLYFEKYILLFANAMENAAYLIGSRYAFRKIQIKDMQTNARKQLINKALFVCISILLAQYDPEKVKTFNSEGVFQNIIAHKIAEDKELLNYLSYGTNGKANLVYTFKVFKELFETHLIY